MTKNDVRWFIKKKKIWLYFLFLFVIFKLFTNGSLITYYEHSLLSSLGKNSVDVKQLLIVKNTLRW